MSRWPALPLFVQVAGRPVMLIGEGEAADAKRRLLERAGALVVGEEDAEARLAIVADDDAAVTRLKARGLLVNAVDRPELCDFTLPAIVDRAPVLVAIGTGGVSAGLAAALRQRLEALLSPKLGALAELLYGARAQLRELHPDASKRRHAIAAALAPGGPLDLTDPCLDYCFNGPDYPHPSAAPPLPPSPNGRVKGPAAAGGGKGEDEQTFAIHHFTLTSTDPDDLTLRQARLLATADRVFHRPGVPAAILDRARADAPRIACPAPPADPGPGLSVDLS